ncbi:MAG: hypothetical protein IKM27_01905, partial [Clostridia bacterium]|nr:hypothetical protein [Clostridia bacterium]
VSVPIVVVKDRSGIYRAIDEVDVKTSTVTGVIIKKGDLSEDKSAREYRIYSNGWYYTFSLPASLDWEPCDKVTLSYVSFAGRSHLYFEEDSVQYRRFTNAEKLESAPISDAMVQTELNLADSTDSTVMCMVKLSLPNTWTVSGSTAARGQIIHFAVATTMSPAASGIDLDLLRTYRGGLLNAVSEKKGTESDPYAYYVYAEAPDYPDWGVTEHVHCYAVFNNGYYVYMMFNADIGISPETLDGILRSVNVGSPWDDTVITISPPGNIINIRLGQGELYVNVQELSAENVEYLQSFLNEHSYMPQTVITFPNKQINFAASPTLISGRTERFEFQDMSLNYVTVDGAIYTKDMETLVAFPPARTGEYTLPDSVKYIDDNAFYGTKLTKLFVPVGVDKGRLIGAEGLAVETVAVEENTTEVTGAVIDVGELTADGKSRYFLVRDGGLVSYRFTAPVDSTIRVGDLVTVTFTGDCTLGNTPKEREKESGFEAFIQKNGMEYPFAKVKHLFEQDDLTV